MGVVTLPKERALRHWDSVIGCASPGRCHAVVGLSDLGLVIGERDADDHFRKINVGRECISPSCSFGLEIERGGLRGDVRGGDDLARRIY